MSLLLMNGQPARRWLHRSNSLIDALLAPFLASCISPKGAPTDLWSAICNLSKSHYYRDACHFSWQCTFPSTRKFKKKKNFSKTSTAFRFLERNSVLTIPKINISKAHATPQWEAFWRGETLESPCRSEMRARSELRRGHIDALSKDVKVGHDEKNSDIWLDISWRSRENEDVLIACFPECVLQMNKKKARPGQRRNDDWHRVWCTSQGFQVER